MHLSSPKYIDISPVLSSKTAVFPGDTPFKRGINMSFSSGSHLDLSDIHTTLHIGAHTDAPSHYHERGKSIEKRDLSLYFGDCQVIEVRLSPEARIYPKDFSDEIKAPRVLFKTNSFSNPDQWKDEFNSLSPELVNFLHQKGVKLVGIDTPSVDPATSKDLPSHKALFETDMALIEGIILTHVKPGLYQLIALPLNIEGADASPVRAILLPKET
jgi:arylformamidase